MRQQIMNHLNTMTERSMNVLFVYDSIVAPNTDLGFYPEHKEDTRYIEDTGGIEGS